MVEMTDRAIGTKVHLSLTATDDGAILPLQEALGYDLAQSMFFHKKNLVLEGLTDMWYLEGITNLLTAAGSEGINEDVALIPANCASKVVYYATILRAQNLKIAALLDSDAEGELAAKQDTLVNALGSKCGWDATQIGQEQAKRPVANVIESVAKGNFSKYKLAKAFIRWSREHDLNDLQMNEITQAENLIGKINKALH